MGPDPRLPVPILGIKPADSVELLLPQVRPNRMMCYQLSII
jgi:hypothetical protein